MIASAGTLSPEQVRRFHEQGFLVVEDAVSAAEVGAMQAELADWTERSRAEKSPFGAPTVDGRPRFDMGAEHSAERPALRRVNNPSDISAAFLAVMRDSRVPDMVAALIGPSVRFHHCKVNLKLPGTHTEVGFHQDFPYTPHSNDDLVTALVMIDDMTAENGPLEVVPGSHRGPLHTLYDGDRFVGYVAAEVEREARAGLVTVTGRSGGVCLMHTRLLHGSAANHSDRSRGLYICVYNAADAVPLAVSPLPNPNQGLLVRGPPTRRVRCVALDLELPPAARPVSFFATQGQHSAGD